MANLYYAPNVPELRQLYTRNLFLAGTIDMGDSFDWQEYVWSKLSHIDDLNVFNPRRKDWDSSWQQDKSDKNFVEQVNWELDLLSTCKLVCFNFEPDSKSPVTMMELGLNCQLHSSGVKDIVVRCPEGFYRKGNIDIVCDRYCIPVVDTLDEMVDLIKGYM